jgi:hypothetical protein
MPGEESEQPFACFRRGAEGRGPMAETEKMGQRENGSD